jgi:hypothetical protein
LKSFVCSFFFLLALLWFPYVRRTTKNGAPFVAMEPDVVERVMKLAEVKKGDVFYDLGSGDGRLVIAAALQGLRLMESKLIGQKCFIQESGFLFLD